jgi:hypothetical protein
MCLITSSQWKQNWDCYIFGNMVLSDTIVIFISWTWELNGLGSGEHNLQRALQMRV